MSQPVPADALAVSHLKSLYFLYLDGRQWDRMIDLFTPDAVFEGYAFDAAGAEDFVATVSAFLSDVRSQHAGYMPRFSAIDDDHIRGVWMMHDYLTWKQDSRVYKGVEIEGMHGLRGWGYYEEEYRRTDAGWRISFSRLVRTRIDPLVGTPLLEPDYDVLGPDFAWLSA